MTKKICAITMARNDNAFLEKWINYYGEQLGKDHLYIFLDGTDQQPPPNADGTHVTKCPRIAGKVVEAEKGRLRLLSDTAAKLLKDYDMVIGVDADEFLIVDPACSNSLAAYLSELTHTPAISALGIDVGQNTHTEETIDWYKPFMQQRRFALITSRYTKPCVMTKPVRWGRGFHRVKGHNFHIDSNLYLLHFGSFDLKMVQDRFLDKDRMAAGWERHMKKRSRTITMVTNLKAKEGDKFLPIARRVQSILRPIYALNKPSMGAWKLIITIPERFKTIL